MGLKQQIKDDWANQPLAIIVASTSSFIGIALFFLGQYLSSASVPSRIENGAFDASYNTSVAIYFTIMPALAWISGRVFRKSFVSGFILSILTAAIGFSIFVGSEIFAVFKGAQLDDGHIDSPLSNLLYWSTVLIFMGVCFHPMSQRLIEVNPIKKKNVNETTEEEGGITYCEIVIVVLVWALVFSSAESKILRYFSVGIDIPTEKASTH